MNGTVVNGKGSWGGPAWTAARWLLVFTVLVGGCGGSSVRNGDDGTRGPRRLAVRETTTQQGGAFSSEPNNAVASTAPMGDDSRASRGPSAVSGVSGAVHKPEPQVLIDCTLVEVTKDDRFYYNLNLVRSSPDLARPSSTTPAEPNTSGSSAPGLIAFYGDKQVAALLETICTENCGRILAKPRLVVPNHGKGAMETKETTYVQVSPPILVPSGTGGSQASPAQIPANYYPCQAGLTLEVTPHILEGGMLQLEIVLTWSDFSTTAGRKPPHISFSKVDTTVTLPDGRTVILGGWRKLNQNQGGSKMPILGDIPLIGGLFRNGNHEDTESRVYLFVKAELGPDGRVGKGTDELTALSERNRAAFERHELEFQRNQDWPGLKPKPPGN